MEDLVLNTFCSMTLFNKMINYRDIIKKLILETFTSSSSFFNSNLKGKISKTLLPWRTQLFFFGGGESKGASKRV